MFSPHEHFLWNKVKRLNVEVSLLKCHTTFIFVVKHNENVLFAGLHVNWHNKSVQKLLLNTNRSIQLKIDSLSSKNNHIHKTQRRNDSAMNNLNGSKFNKMTETRDFHKRLKCTAYSSAHFTWIFWNLIDSRCNLSATKLFSSNCCQKSVHQWIRGKIFKWALQIRDFLRTWNENILRI